MSVLPLVQVSEKPKAALWGATLSQGSIHQRWMGEMQEQSSAVPWDPVILPCVSTW